MHPRRLMKARNWLFLISLGSAAIGVNPASAQMHMQDHYAHQFENAEKWAKTFDDPTRDHYFRRVKEKLKPGGRLVIVDFRQDAVLGPPKHFRISPDQVKQELSLVGFDFVKEDTFLPQQYFLVFQATP